MEAHKLKVEVLSERTTVRFAEEASLFGVVSLVGPQFEEKERAAIDVVVVLDKSGSMEGEKLKVAIQTMQFVVKNLRDQDKLSLILYDTDVVLSFPLTKMNAEGKDMANKIISGIRSGSSTNLSGGLLKGIEVMKQRGEDRNKVSSVLLLTDGLANVGLQKDEEIVGAMKGALDGHDDISVYTFGFGPDHKAMLLKAISDNARGMYYFVETPDQIPDSFGDCLGGLLSVVAQNVTVAFAVENGTITTVHSKKEQTFSPDRSSCSLNLGDVQSEEVKNLVFEFSLPKYESVETAKHAQISAKITYFNVVTSAFEEFAQVLLIARPIEAALEVPNALVEKQKKRILAANAMAEGLKLAEASKFDEARTRVKSVFEKLKCDDDMYAQELCDDLEQCMDGLSSQQRYKSYGAHKMCSTTQSHYEERSNVGAHSRGYVSYAQNSKVAFKKAFK